MLWISGINTSNGECGSIEESVHDREWHFYGGYDGYLHVKFSLHVVWIKWDDENDSHPLSTGLSIEVESNMGRIAWWS